MKRKHQKHGNGPNGQTEPESVREPAILSSIADGVVVSDVEGRVCLVNGAGARLLGVDPGSAVGEPARRLFEPFQARGPVTVPDVMDRLYADPYTSVRGEEAPGAVFALGTRVIHAHLSPVMTEAGAFLGIVTVLHDITREVEVERARTDLVLDLSRELRGPVTAIKGYSEMLLEQVSDQLEEHQVQFLRIIQRNSDHLVGLLRDLTDISQVVSSQVELDLRPVQMETIVRNVARMIEQQCDERGVALAVEIDPDAGQVLGDKNRLTQAMASLAGDVCRRTAEGGRVALVLSCVEGAVRTSIESSAADVASGDQAARQPARRPEGADVSGTEGTGLEQVIARMLVETHGGRMWVEREPEQRRAFTFELPLHTEAWSVVARGKPVRVGEGHTVLVVEDDTDVAQLIMLQLRHAGFDVHVAGTGEEALRLARTEEVDLITLDILLPDITGMEVLHRLKADSATAHIPVIIVSVLQPGAGDDDSGAVEHVTKPFELRRLMDSIQRTLGGG